MISYKWCAGPYRQIFFKKTGRPTSAHPNYYYQLSHYYSIVLS